MSVTDSIVVPAGWYPDPSDDTRLRWWSGEAWTEHRSDPIVREPQVAPVATTQSQPDAVAEGTAPVSAATPDAWWIPAEQPAEPESRLTPGWRPIALPVDWHTPHAWWLACLPLIGAVGSIVSLVLFLTESQSALSLPFGVGTIVATITIAVRDRRALIERGAVAPPSLWWLLLGAVGYLGVRALAARRAGGHGAGPFWLGLGNWMLAAVVAVIVAFNIFASAFVAPSLALEQTLQEDLASQGIVAVVECPADASFTVGSTITCSISGGMLTAATVTVVDGGMEYTVR